MFNGKKNGIIESIEHVLKKSIPMITEAGELSGLVADSKSVFSRTASCLSPTLEA